MNKIYKSNGKFEIENLEVPGSGGAVWGSITGDINDQSDLQSEFGGKQDTLVSGTNIKTINGSSVLGSGDLSVGGISQNLAIAFAIAL